MVASVLLCQEHAGLPFVYCTDARVDGEGRAKIVMSMSWFPARLMNGKQAVRLVMPTS